MNVVGAPLFLPTIGRNGIALIDEAALLAHMSGPDGDRLNVRNVAVSGDGGYVYPSGPRSWVFVPGHDFVGNVVLTYEVTGGTTAMETTATVPVNGAPVPGGEVELHGMNEDGPPLIISTKDLLANASDPNGDTLSVTALSVDPVAGTLTDNVDGTWTFASARDFDGTALFTYTVSDGLESTPATATMTVAPVNDAPVVDGDAVLTSINQASALTVKRSELLARASDVDGDELSIGAVASNDGAVEEISDGVWRFTPDPDFVGQAVLTYTVSDGHGATVQATASMDVIPLDLEIAGADGRDVLPGGPGNDTISAGGGDDIAFGGSGNDTLDGGAGNDRLIGGYGDDTLTGGDGDDTLIGGAGKDVYLFNRGDGRDTVINTGEGASGDRVQYGAEIDHDQLWFRMVDDDLEISVIGTEDRVTVDGWRDGAGNRLDIQAGDGAVVTAARVANLISAMAAFAPPAMGATSLDSQDNDNQPVLAAIAENWSV